MAIQQARAVAFAPGVDAPGAVEAFRLMVSGFLVGQAFWLSKLSG
jgi:hypothetical protein